MLTRDELDRTWEFGVHSGATISWLVVDPPPGQASLAEVFALAAQAAGLAAENAALREVLARCRDILWAEGGGSVRFITAALSSPSPRAKAYEAAMELANACLDSPLCWLPSRAAVARHAFRAALAEEGKQ